MGRRQLKHIRQKREYDRQQTRRLQCERELVYRIIRSNQGEQLRKLSLENATVVGLLRRTNRVRNMLGYARLTNADAMAMVVQYVRERSGATSSATS